MNTLHILIALLVIAFVYLRTHRSSVMEKIKRVEDYFNKTHPDHSLILVGNKESLVDDLKCDDCVKNITEAHFIHLTNDKLAAYPAAIQQTIRQLNSLTMHPQQPFNSKNNNKKGCPWLGLHTLGLLTKKNNKAKELQTCGYGNERWNGLRVYSRFCRTHACGTEY